MKIQGLPYGNNGINNINGKNTHKVSSRNVIKRSDSVGNSGYLLGKDKVDGTPFVAETEFEPRVELMESVSERLSNGIYNAPDILEKIAEKVIDAHVATDSISDILMDQVRPEKIEEVNDNIIKNYYDNSEVMQEIATKIINNLGFSRLFGGNNNS